MLFPLLSLFLYFLQLPLQHLPIQDGGQPLLQLLLQLAITGPRRAVAVAVDAHPAAHQPAQVVDGVDVERVHGAADAEHGEGHDIDGGDVERLERLHGPVDVGFVVHRPRVEGRDGREAAPVHRAARHDGREKEEDAAADEEFEVVR